MVNDPFGVKTQNFFCVKLKKNLLTVHKRHSHTNRKRQRIKSLIEFLDEL